MSQTHTNTRLFDLTMADDDSWKFFGKEKGFFYSVYDNTRNSLSRKLVEYIIGKSYGKEGLVVVEGGSGPGQGSVFMSMKKRVKHAIALDHDVNALGMGKKTNPKLSKVAGDLTMLPFKDKSVDILWNSSTMEHLDKEELDKSLGEISRVLKDDGFVFIGVPYRYGPLGLSVFMGKGMKEWTGKLFSKNELRERVKGFRVVSWRIYFFRFFVGAVLKKNVVGLNGERNL